ncbi:hypothetical protein CAEBREN_08330 [Caenorhabditis brenneri]|uniref:Uncharacterized protein n=1 Tax=Caenorhabditis brenneri TaxID=135651 RepID=G0M8L5_CAEBE|nr:hypothetical protein CAEBREN_08330 [Caenorhabditis brenneri]
MSPQTQTIPSFNGTASSARIPVTHRTIKKDSCESPRIPVRHGIVSKTVSSQSLKYEVNHQIRPRVADLSFGLNQE